ncbi:hypothetical protein Y710_08525 [Gordonia sp. QH-12]|uniref:DUF559 domain-containing protein n=1 Tax=Gordonia sp. QH-12 TaxID=1437876 RepID=UPI000780DAFE|nr:DUF559 domain-containing protein [Gordonia sp. QH-12]KXT57469.1 hypothetical protein Y710_08525 [Gordonia sp. QH-12]
MNAIRSGVYPYREIERMIGRARLNDLIRRGHAEQLRRGWYRIGEARSDDVAAVRRGGVVSCMSALRRHGVWVPADDRLHVRGNSWAVQHLRGPFCRQFGRPVPEAGAVDDLPTALRHAARCLDAEGFVVVCDSVLNLRLMHIEELEYLFRDAPKSVRLLIDECDPNAESGPESMARRRLRTHRVPVRTQVKIDGVGRVDLLIGDYLIIEIDGWEIHGDRPHFQSDRTRDATAFDLGYHTLRFTYDDIVFRWKATLAKIIRAVRNGAHMRPAQRAQH